jgi:hypothetical protein
MTYATPFLKLSWLFEIGGTDENAETSLGCANAGWDEADAQAALADIDTTTAEAIGQIMVNILADTPPNWADYSDYVGLKCAAVDINGHYLTDPRIFDGYQASGNNANVLPQATLVMSLRSNSNLGRGNRGRMYLPHSSADLETGTPRMSSTRAADIGGLFSSFIYNLKAYTETWAGTPTPLIMSRFGSGVNKPIALVGCGRVVDTQRRRRGQLVEDTVYVAPTP